MPLGWYFCLLVSSPHPHWEAKDSFEPRRTVPLQECMPKELWILFARDWMRQATCSSRAHSLPFLLLLGRSSAGGKLWRLMQTLPRIHNSNSHSNFHLAYSLLVSACVQSSTDELAQNVGNVGGKNTVIMPYF